MALLASNYSEDPVDVIIGDWLSEANMTSRAAMKADGNVIASILEFVRPTSQQMAAKLLSLRFLNRSNQL